MALTKVIGNGLGTVAGLTISDGGNIGSASDTDALSIDSTGRLTKSQVPAFIAYRDAGDLTSATDVIFNQVVLNAGSHYDTSNGRFTAPVAGKYQFNAFLSHNGSGTANTGIARGQINGSFQNWLFPICPAIDHVSITLTFVANLSANDYVNIHTGTSAQMLGSGNIHNHFSGYLIG
tara:strand:+ start:35 stop:565 length:531 start_codon:yes stop_codon:yes gene_type:complete